MKKIILSVVTLLVFGFANAQEAKESTSSFKFGIKGGANYDWLTTGSFSVYDLRPEVGYHVGLLVEYKLCDMFAIQPEVLYSSSSFSFEGNGNKSGDKLELQEILVPVVAKFYLTKKLSLEAGPQAGFVLEADINGKDSKDDFTSFKVAAISGLGYDLGKGVFVQARYFYNFLNLQNNFSGNNHYGIQASLGYKF